MKIFGAALVVLSSVLAGYWFSRRLYFASESCDELLRIMKYVSDEIAVNKTPTNVILRRLSAEKDLSDVCEKGLYSALLPRISALTPDEREIFRIFCDRVGKGGAEVQKTQFDSLSSQLEEKASRRRAELSKNGRLCISLSLFIGALIIIIMI